MSNHVAAVRAAVSAALFISTGFQFLVDHGAIAVTVTPVSFRITENYGDQYADLFHQETLELIDTFKPQLQRIFTESLPGFDSLRVAILSGDTIVIDVVSQQDEDTASLPNQVLTVLNKALADGQLGDLSVVPNSANTQNPHARLDLVSMVTSASIRVSDNHGDKYLDVSNDESQQFINSFKPELVKYLQENVRGFKLVIVDSIRDDIIKLHVASLSYENAATLQSQVVKATEDVLEDGHLGDQVVESISAIVLEPRLLSELGGEVAALIEAQFKELELVTTPVSANLEEPMIRTLTEIVTTKRSAIKEIVTTKRSAIKEIVTTRRPAIADESFLPIVIFAYASLGLKLAYDDDFADLVSAKAQTLMQRIEPELDQQLKTYVTGYQLNSVFALRGSTSVELELALWVDEESYDPENVHREVGLALQAAVKDGELGDVAADKDSVSVEMPSSTHHMHEAQIHLLRQEKVEERFAQPVTLFTRVSFQLEKNYGNVYADPTSVHSFHFINSFQAGLTVFLKKYVDGFQNDKVATIVGNTVIFDVETLSDLDLNSLKAQVHHAVDLAIDDGHLGFQDTVHFSTKVQTPRTSQEIENVDVVDSLLGRDDTHKHAILTHASFRLQYKRDDTYSNLTNPATQKLIDALRPELNSQFERNMHGYDFFSVAQIRGDIIVLDIAAETDEYYASFEEHVHMALNKALEDGHLGQISVVSNSAQNEQKPDKLITAEGSQYAT